MRSGRQPVHPGEQRCTWRKNRLQPASNVLRSHARDAPRPRRRGRPCVAATKSPSCEDQEMGEWQWEDPQWRDRIGDDAQGLLLEALRRAVDIRDLAAVTAPLGQRPAFLVDVVTAMCKVSNVNASDLWTVPNPDDASAPRGIPRPSGHIGWVDATALSRRNATMPTCPGIPGAPPIWSTRKRQPWKGRQRADQVFGHQPQTIGVRGALTLQIR